MFFCLKICSVASKLCFFGSILARWCQNLFLATKLCFLGSESAFWDQYIYLNSGIRIMFLRINICSMESEWCFFGSISALWDQNYVSSDQYLFSGIKIVFLCIKIWSLTPQLCFFGSISALLDQNYVSWDQYLFSGVRIMLLWFKIWFVASKSVAAIRIYLFDEFSLLRDISVFRVKLLVCGIRIQVLVLLFQLFNWFSDQISAFLVFSYF